MFNKNNFFADDWIWTADLWYWKRPLYQLSHNHFPTFVFYHLSKVCRDYHLMLKWIVAAKMFQHLIWFSLLFHNNNHSFNLKTNNFRYQWIYFPVFFQLLILKSRNWMTSNLSSTQTNLLTCFGPFPFSISFSFCKWAFPGAFFFILPTRYVPSLLHYLSHCFGHRNWIRVGIMDFWIVL